MGLEKKQPACKQQAGPRARALLLEKRLAIILVQLHVRQLTAVSHGYGINHAFIC